jgi:hypothetical protein
MFFSNIGCFEISMGLQVIRPGQEMSKWNGRTPLSILLAICEGDLDYEEMRAFEK